MADGKVELADIDIAYREYIYRIWSDFGKHLSGDLLQGQYRQLEQLRVALQKMDEPRQADDLAAAIAHVKAEFWRRESELRLRYIRLVQRRAYNAKRDML